MTKRTIITKKINTKNYNVPALEKGLDIIEELSQARNPISLSNLSERIGKSSSELYRMISCLERRNYISRDKDLGMYQLSSGIFELANRYFEINDLINLSYKQMRILSNTVRESCHLSILFDGKLIVIAQVESPEKIRWAVEVGAHFSPIKTVSGTLLLAHLEINKLNPFLENCEEYKLMNPFEKNEYRNLLENINAEGSIYTGSGLIDSIRDISILVGNHRNGIIASLTIPYLKSSGSTYEEEKLIEALKECSKKINEALGGELYV